MRAIALQSLPVDSFEAAGPKDAPAIVFVHGSVVTRKMWLPQLRELSSSYRVLALDLPGHGTFGQTPFTFAAAVAQTATFIRSEARGSALVVGLSLGGYVSIELAHCHPELISGLVLAGCTMNFTGILGIYMRTVGGLMQRGWLKPDPEKMARRTRRLFPPALADVAAEQLSAGLYPGPLGPAFSEMGRKDFLAMLATYPGHTLLLNGERDVRMCRGAKSFVAAARRGSARTIADAGHASNLDQPVLFSRYVAEFAGSLQALMA